MKIINISIYIEMLIEEKYKIYFMLNIHLINVEHHIFCYYLTIFICSQI